MAITRSQQAKQMLRNGGMSLQEAKDMAPEGEFLAYINPKEAKMLKAAGGSGVMTKAGIPSFVEYGGESGFSGARSTGSVQGDVDRGGDRPNMGDVTGPSMPTTNPVFGDPDPEIDVSRKNRRDTITRFVDNLRANVRSNPFSIVSPTSTFLRTAFQTERARRALGVPSPKPITPNTDDDDDTTGIMQYAFTPFQQDVIEDSMDTGPIAEAIRLRDQMGGPRLFAAEGGIMDLEQAREGYKLGKLVKKIGRSIKKIGKSKVGKAALTAAATFKLGGGKFSNLFKGEDTGFSLDNIPFMPSDRKDQLALAASAGLVAAPFIFGEDDTEDEYQKFLAQRGGQGFDIPGIRAKPYDTLARAFVAEGGKPEPVAKKTMPLLDMGGKEMDLREEGGFVPIGRMEKADDVPARLSKNEFVFTADAVRNAGDGNVDKGAEVMYNMMKNLEAGGEVSEESQGLDGARKMFQTSQRLEEVL